MIINVAIPISYADDSVSTKLRQLLFHVDVPTKCEISDTIGEFMDALNSSNGFKSSGLEILDVTNVKTISRTNSQLVCRGIIEVNNSQKNLLIFRFNINSQGNGIWRIDPQ